MIALTLTNKRVQSVVFRKVYSQLEAAVTNQQWDILFLARQLRDERSVGQNSQLAESLGWMSFGVAEQEVVSIVKGLLIGSCLRDLILLKAFIEVYP